MRNNRHVRNARLLVLSAGYSHGEDVQGVHGTSHHLKVVLQDGDGARERLVPAAAEQRHTGVEEDGGDQRRVRDAAQAFDAALKAPWEKMQIYTSIYALKKWIILGFKQGSQSTVD